MGGGHAGPPPIFCVVSLQSWHQTPLLRCGGASLNLDNAAVRTHWRLMIWLIEEPEAVPFFSHIAKVF